MKHWVVTLSFFLIFYFFIQPINIEAHSGRTNSSGCHNCNVGSCAGEYHCHNGGSSGGGGSRTGAVAQPSCPSMSKYNSSTGTCECYSGYIATGNSCISINQACQNKYGYNSKATTSGDECECKSGYTWNKATTKCITNDAACQELNGLMSKSNLSGNCECLPGYESNGSQCVKKRIIEPTPTIIKKEIIKTPTISIPNLSGDISFVKDIETSLPDIKLGNKGNNISTFFSKLFSWLFD